MCNRRKARSCTLHKRRRHLAAALVREMARPEGPQPAMPLRLLIQPLAQPEHSMRILIKAKVAKERSVDLTAPLRSLRTEVEPQVRMQNFSSPNPPSASISQTAILIRTSRQ